MSDLYLELRSRIAVVAEKTHLGTARIEEAQKVLGLSNESIARRVPVSERTWRRWKEAGEIPTASLPAVATALRLELRELKPDGDDRPNGHQGISREEAAAIHAKLDRILGYLEPPEEPQSGQGSVPDA